MGPAQEKPTGLQEMREEEVTREPNRPVVPLLVLPSPGLTFGGWGRRYRLQDRDARSGCSGSQDFAIGGGARWEGETDAGGRSRARCRRLGPRGWC